VDPARAIGVIAAAVGGIVVVVTTFIGSQFTLLSPGFAAYAAYALFPYAVLLLASFIVRSPWAIAGAGIAAIAVEIGIRGSVFVYPRGSTAAVALVFSPMFIAVVGIPVGAAVGWLLGRAWRRGGLAVRAGVIIVVVLLTLMTMIGFARPELMPGPVLRRHAVLARIGAPRVVTGATAFESIVVSSTQAWFQTGSFDAGPAEQIAVIHGDGAVLLDPLDFHERARVPFHPDVARRWNWNVALARLAGRLVAVRTGGGYADTEVQTLDGVLLWRFRPSPQLPAVALKPADLDADGRLEFYGDNGDFVARLDADGHELWRRPTRYPAGLVLSGPRTGATPAWVVALQNDRISIWDERGSLLAELSTRASDVTAVADWPERRTLLIGDTTLRGRNLDGTLAFEIPLGDFRFSEAVAIRFVPGGPRYLAIVGAAPRDVRRWRLFVLAPDRTPVYDEVLEQWVRLLVARRPDGADTLLVSSQGLRALRPR
jgi:hypothetical protein